MGIAAEDYNLLLVGDIWHYAMHIMQYPPPLPQQ